MVNTVKPVSNQVKPFADVAYEVDRGVQKWSDGGKNCQVGKWQKVTISGILSDIMWHWVPDKVSYSQINSPIVTFGHILGKNIFFAPPESER